MTCRLAPTALVLALVVGLPALAWAQDSDPTMAGTVSPGGIAGAIALMAVTVREGIALLRSRDQADRDQARLVSQVESVVRQQLEPVRGLVTAMDSRLIMLETHRQHDAPGIAQAHSELEALAKDLRTLATDLNRLGASRVPTP